MLGDLRILVESIEKEYPEVKAYAILKDYGNNLVLEIRKDNVRYFHTFLVYDEAPMDYIIKAGKEFAATIINNTHNA